ncbi:hypothetical protein BSG1_00995 [Bacillus sp. SG-1]|nr:hypothetical protein BSG1_00995 [Bacillus sp. SG-1]
MNVHSFLTIIYFSIGRRKENYVVLYLGFLEVVKIIGGRA